MPIGVIGGGLVAQAVHLPLLQRLGDRFRVVALAEPDADVRATVASRHAIVAAYPDHCALLEAGRVRTVIVCSPNDTHARIVVDALEAGVHVLVEKPVCVTAEEGDWILSARDRTGLVVQVGYMKRFDPAVEALLGELPAAWRPQHITTATFDPGLRAAFGYGPAAPMSVADAFLGALVHDVNLVRALLARTDATVDAVVDGFADADGPRVGATIRLSTGARWTAVWLGLPGAGTFREHVALYGPDGVRELEFPAPYVLGQPTLYRHLRAAAPGAATTTRSSFSEAYERQLLHFHACITAGTACRTPPEDGIEDVRLLSEMFAGAVA